MMISHILKFVNSLKAKKSKHLESEAFLMQIKKLHERLYIKAYKKVF